MAEGRAKCSGMLRKQEGEDKRQQDDAPLTTPLFARIHALHIRKNTSTSISRKKSSHHTFTRDLHQKHTRCSLAISSKKLANSAKKNSLRRQGNMQDNNLLRPCQKKRRKFMHFREAPQFSFVVSHYTDTHIYVLYLALALFMNDKKSTVTFTCEIVHISFL